ncbi:nucleotidyltransferase family protein [Bacteroides acidifaciens]|uniref:nucleotidyltransferase domain-containing protein n=1 Tax=Bacteroides acidifaciens TaxID=85831 RepID=UPI0025893902|nr:nucleotidyltransferase family protein [Bacteroides acidifaciens]
MKRTEQQFLELLQSGLWQRPAAAKIFRGPTDWNELFRLSKEQTVFGVVYDGIVTLPKELRPPRAFLMNWYAQVSYIEDMNRALNHTLTGMYDSYREQGFTPVLLKGQGLAACYPNPLHRTPGDIDWLMGEQDYRRANEWVKRNGMAADAKESNNHLQFTFEEQVIENHVECIKLYRNSDQQFLRSLTKKWFPAGSTTCRIQDKDIAVPPPAFNAVFLLLHIAKHLMGKGIGLRQICDWCRFLYVHRERIDKEELAGYIRSFHLEALWNIFGRLSVVYLGYPEADMLCLRPGCEKQGRRVMRHIFVSGNFGHYNKVWKGRPVSYWRGKYFAFRKEMSRLVLLYRISPSDTWSFFVFFTKRGVKQVISDMF